VDTNSVLVLPTPTASLVSSDGDNTICEGESVTFTAGGGVIYEFYVNGVPVQSGASSTYITTSLTDGSAVHVIATNASGCSDISADIITTVNARPVPTLTGEAVVCTEDIETYNTEAGMSNYSWTVIGGSVSAGGGPADNTVTVTWDTIGAQTVSVNYEISEHFDAGLNWVYSTAIPVTVPTAGYYYGDVWIPDYSERGGTRIPGTAYHRMDLSVNYYFKTFKLESNLNLSVYNVYNRHNAFAVYFRDKNLDGNPQQESGVEAVKLYLFPIVPAITYNIKF